MDRNLDDVFDRIIKNEEKMYARLSFKEQTETNPTFFKEMKKMYVKDWEGIRNPNNIFIPFILVSIESVLRRLVVVDKQDQKVYPINILDRLLSDKSPLKNIESKIVYHIGEEISGNHMTILAEVDSEELIDEAKNYISEEWNIPKEKLVVLSFDKNGYQLNLSRVLTDIRNNYYSNKNKFKNSYRNMIMHANRPLLIEDDKIFEQILKDYCSLITSFWPNVVQYSSNKGETL